MRFFAFLFLFVISVLQAEPAGESNAVSDVVWAEYYCISDNPVLSYSQLPQNVIWSDFALFQRENHSNQQCFLRKKITQAALKSWTQPTVAVGPAYYSYRLYQNGIILGSWGHPHGSVPKYTSQQFSLETQNKNTDVSLVLQVFVVDKTFALPSMIFGDFASINAKVEWRNLLNSRLVSGFSVVNLVMFLLLLVYWFVSNRKDDPLLYLSLASLSIAIAYSTRMLEFEAFNGVLSWIIARSALVAGGLCILLFAVSHITKIQPWMKKLFAASVLLVIFSYSFASSGDDIHLTYRWHSYVLLYPALVSAVIILIVAALQRTEWLLKLVASTYILGLCLVVFDVYNYLSGITPYVWMTPYAFFFLVSISGLLMALERMNVSKSMEYQSNLISDSRSRIRMQESARIQLINSLAHSLATPLHGVLGTLKNLENDPDVALKWNEELKESTKALNHLNYQFQRVKDLDAIHQNTLVINLRDFAIADLGREVEEALGLDNVKDYIQVNIGDNYWISSDPERLLLIIQALLQNALEAGGDAPVELSIYVREESSGANLYLEVSDSGEGIDEETRLFILGRKNLSKVKYTRKGDKPGLGYPLILGALKAMVGKLDIYHRSPQGTTVQVKIPVQIKESNFRNHKTSMASVKSLQNSDKKASKDSQPSRKVLLVEDNKLNRQVGKILLEKLGFEVEEAYDGAQAVEKIGEHKWAVVFMDIRMPKMNGLDASRKIREIYTSEDFPIIALTANGDFQECQDAGMDGFLTKPAHATEILQELERLGVHTFST